MTVGTTAKMMKVQIPMLPPGQEGKAIVTYEIRRILRHGASEEKAWVITRILERAKWGDIWRYLTVDDIRQHLDLLRFRHPQDRELWAYALERWTKRG